MIVFNRGSYTRGDVAPELLTMFRRLALEGFTIVAPMYRGSDGGEGRDEMGGADLNDLLGVPAVLSQLRGVDTGNVFLYGESRGGMMVLQALREGFPARAAATFGAFTDLAEIVAGAQGQKMAAAIWPDFEERADQVVRRRSALRWADSLRVPLLLMQGAADGEVPPTHSLRLAAKLLESRSDVGVILFPGADHIIGRDREERDRQAVRFFRMHIQH